MNRLPLFDVDAVAGLLVLFVVLLLVPLDGPPPSINKFKLINYVI